MTLVFFKAQEPTRVLLVKAEGEWITVHPNGPGSTGQPVLVKDGTVIAGAGGKLNGEKLSELGSDASRERYSHKDDGRINAKGQGTLFREVKATPKVSAHAAPERTSAASVPRPTEPKAAGTPSKPAADRPKSYPWENASEGHLIHRMSDDELVSSMSEALKTPRSRFYLDAMRISTRSRRNSLAPEKNHLILGEMAEAERTAKLRDTKG